MHSTPNVVTIEKEIIQFTLQDPEHVNLFLENDVQSCLFFNPLHQKIWDAVLDLANNDKPVEIFGVSTYLDEREADYVYTLCDQKSTPDSLCGKHVGIVNYVDQLKATYKKRAVYNLANDLLMNVDNPNVVQIFRDMVEEVNSKLDTGSPGTTLAMGVDMLRVRRQEIIDSPYEFAGQPCGIKELDGLISGIDKGKFIAISAATSRGKSTLAYNMILPALLSGQRVVMYSLEMHPMQVALKYAGMLSGINTNEYKMGKLSDSDNALFEKALDKIKSLDLEIRSSPRWENIYGNMLKETRNPKTTLFVLDYIGSVKDGSRDKHELQAEIASIMQNLMQRTQRTLLCVVQLNKEQAKNAGSDDTQMRGAGEISEAADIIIKLDFKNNQEEREERKKKNIPFELFINVVKNREGGTGPKLVYLHGPTSRIMSEEKYLRLYGGFTQTRHSILDRPLS